MQALIEFAPVAAFLAAYYVAGLYVATAVLMAGMAIVIGVGYLRSRRIAPLYALSTVVVVALGAATLILHDQRFIQWKPTVFFWLLAIAFLGSGWVGAKPLAQRLLETALGGPIALGRASWLRLNLAWVIFYAALGVANLYVARNASERTWVHFKVFGLTLAMIVFVGAQALWVSRQAALPAAARSGDS
jgi:intracellular septation protein